MASYPTTIYDPRTKENDSGIEYAPEQTTVLFAEDVEKLDDEVVAIQGELGTEPFKQIEKTENHTLELTDRKKIILMNDEDPLTLTVPHNDDVAFPLRSAIIIRQGGAGTVSIVGDTDVVIQSQDTALDLAGQYAMATLIKIGTNLWALEGNLVVAE